jgi:hypothetical protein
MSDAQAVPMNLEAHVAVQTVELRHVREAVERIEAAQGGHVSRTEYEQRNGYVDGQFHATTTKIQAVEDEMKAQRAPWWVVLGAGLGGVSAVVALLTVVTK